MGIFNKNRKEKPKKETKVTYDLNAAIATGKDTWRKITEFMQWLPKGQDILKSDISILEDIIKEYRNKGGIVEFNETYRTWETEYSCFKIKFEYDEKNKFKGYEVKGEDPKISKDVLKEISIAVSAYSELDKRKFALEVMNELIAYLDDAATKDSIDHILERLKDNNEVLFKAISGEGSMFDLNVDDIAAEVDV